MLTRRTLLHQLAALAASAAGVRAASGLKTDIAVIGGGAGGCAAALAALRNGMRVAMTEETDWVGGQLTSQLVPPDEHPWIESFGATRLYRRYRDGVREYYRRNYPLTASARGRVHLNPGDGSVSPITHEPRVSLEVLEAMLAPFVSGGRLTLLLRHKPAAADASNGRLRSVTVENLESGSRRVIEAAYFLDATEQGDLLPLAATEFVTGAESRKQTGEVHAPESPQPANMQAFTVCFAIDYRSGEDHTIEKPAEYNFWRDYVPEMRPPWPGKLLDWRMSHPITLAVRPMLFDPTLRAEPKDRPNLWLYRRIANRLNFEPGAYASDISLINWPQNDYWLGNPFEVSTEESERHLRRARQLSLSLLYWMQTEAERPDGGAGWKGLRLRGDLAGSEDGLAKYPYIRESRRIKAEFTVLEQHVGTDARMKATGANRDEVRAEDFPDSVGVGSYRIDLHPSSGGDNYIDVSSLPFQIPLGALIPVRTENLIPACKNIGTTHITNGCYRLHPVEWNIGESAGALAAHSVRTGHPPRHIRNTENLLAGFQASLRDQGVELEWPRLTPR